MARTTHKATLTNSLNSVPGQPS